MPTGYTHSISEGISFKDFTMNCARNFGALVMMRDEPSDAPIPEKFEASDYHTKELKKAKDEFDFLASLTDEQCAKYASEDHDKKIEDWHKRTAENTSLKNKYNEMLSKVIQWEPPTKDHVGLKDFMASQIRQSINWDCSDPERPEKLSGKQWYAEKLKSVEWKIDYHTKQDAEEKNRAAGRTEWVKALRDSLSDVTEP